MATQRGRKSAAEVTTRAAQARADYPEPPGYFSAAQRDWWRALVRGRTGGYFTPDTWPILEAMIYHATTAEHIAKRIARLERNGTAFASKADEYRKLVAMRLDESKAAEARARTLRLTPQARYRPDGAKTQPRTGGQARPWEE